MTDVAKIIEVVGSSTKSWEDAAQKAIERACQTCRNVRGIDVVSQTAKVRDNKVTEYRACVKVAFAVDDED